MVLSLFLTSYFSILNLFFMLKQKDSTFDIQLILLDLNIMEWLDSVELICGMTDMKKVECVLVLCLNGWVFKVYR